MKNELGQWAIYDELSRRFDHQMESGNSTLSERRRDEWKLDRLCHAVTEYAHGNPRYLDMLIANARELPDSYAEYMEKINGQRGAA